MLPASPVVPPIGWHVHFGLFLLVIWSHTSDLYPNPSVLVWAPLYWHTTHLPQLRDSLITINWITLKARNLYWDRRLYFLLTLRQCSKCDCNSWGFSLFWGGLLQFGLVESWQAPLPKILFHRNLCFSTYLRSLSLTGFQTLLGLSIWIQRECILRTDLPAHILRIQFG